MGNTVISTKISTGISGLDELFYGGLRLPDPKGDKGICIAIYGNRGISKQDIAMQMMYGIAKNWLGSSCKYYDINRNMKDMEARYYGLHIGRMIQQIRQPKNNNPACCELCEHFNLTNNIIQNHKFEGLFKGEKKRADRFSLKNSTYEQSEYVRCNRKDKCKEVFCDLCHLIKREIINYNDRTNSLHWTIGDSSDNKNRLAEGRENMHDCFSNIFEYRSREKLTSKQKYVEIFQAIKSLQDNYHSSIVIGGFTAIEAELGQIPYNILMNELRRKAKVSILVFDERGKDLHLNADILIEMRVREDEQSHYIHHELRVAKSDLQRHVYGWHHYKKLRDLSIEVFPNVHTLMSQRFASTHALLRLERDSLEYPQTLLQLFQNGMGVLEENVDNYPHIINKLNDSKNDVPVQISRTKIELDYWSVAQPIKDALQNGADVLALLFGKQATQFRQSIIDSYGNKEYIDALSQVHSWEIRPGDIQPAEILFVVKQYLRDWSTKHGKDNEVYIYVDDLAQLGLYPMVDKEELFLPAMLSLCNDACHERDCYKKNILEKATIVLHVVCSDRACPQFRYAVELQKWSNNLKLMKK